MIPPSVETAPPPPQKTGGRFPRHPPHRSVVGIRSLLGADRGACGPLRLPLHPRHQAPGAGQLPLHHLRLPHAVGTLPPSGMTPKGVVREVRGYFEPCRSEDSPKSVASTLARIEAARPSLCFRFGIAPFQVQQFLVCSILAPSCPTNNLPDPFLWILFLHYPTMCGSLQSCHSASFFFF